MATATVEYDTRLTLFTDEELARDLQKAEAEIRAIGKDVEWLDGSITQTVDQIAAVTRSYNQACRKLAAGEAVDVLGIKTQMVPLEAKLEGLKQSLAEKQRELAPLTATKEALSQEQFARHHRREVERERNTINAEIEEALSLVKARDEAHEKLNRAIGALRNRRCLTESNVSLTKNGAHRVERFAHGAITF